MDHGHRARQLVATTAEAVGHGRRAYLEAVQAMLAVLVPAEVILWSSTGSEPGSLRMESDQPLPRERLGLVAERLVPTAAVTTWSRDRGGLPPPVRVTDIVAARRLPAEPIVRELWQPLGVDRQLAVATAPVQPGSRVEGWRLLRAGRDFSDDEVALLAAAQPSLVLLHQLVEAHRSPASPLQDDRLSQRARARLSVLTPRERQVVELLGQGWTASHIGRQLRISRRTVGKHLEHVYAKLGTHDRLRTARLLAPEVISASPWTGN